MTSLWVNSSNTATNKGLALLQYCASSQSSINRFKFHNEQFYRPPTKHNVKITSKEVGSPDELTLKDKTRHVNTLH